MKRFAVVLSIIVLFVITSAVGAYAQTYDITTTHHENGGMTTVEDLPGGGTSTRYTPPIKTYKDPVRVIINLNSEYFSQKVDPSTVKVEFRWTGAPVYTNSYQDGGLEYSTYWTGHEFGDITENKLTLSPDLTRLEGTVRPSNYILRITWGNKVVYYGGEITVDDITAYGDGVAVFNWLNYGPPVQSPQNRIISSTDDLISLIVVFVMCICLLLLMWRGLPPRTRS